MTELALCPACASESSQDWVREQASWTYVMLHWLPSYFFFFFVWRRSGNSWRRMVGRKPASTRLHCDFHS